jgi:DNA polymerase I
MHKKKGYSGALILEPKHGLHENIVAVDVVSLYPTAILDLNVDILDFAGQVLPYYVAYFFRRKMEEEEKGNRIGRETYKILANAIYGMFGYERFRFFDESKAELVTKKGREVLLKMVDVVKDIGFEVVYGDTDSIFIKPEGVGDVKAIVDYMNSQIRPYRVSLDMVFDKIIFFGSGEKGVKKRYIGVSGDKWKVRGIEVRRGDWSQFSKDVIWDVVKMIFGGCSKRDVETYLANVKSKLYRGYYDSKLLMVKSIQDSKKYKVEPAHFKLWKWGVSAGLIPSYSIEVEYYYKRGSKSGGLSLGLWCEVDKRFDYDEYWRKQVLAPVNRIVESVWGSRIIDVGGGLGLENYI